MQTGSALRRSFYLNQNTRHFLRSLGWRPEPKLGNLIQARTSVTRDVTRMLNLKPQSINKGACFLWAWVSPVPMAHPLEGEVRDATDMPLALAVE